MQSVVLTEQQIRRLTEAAVQAPSGHNSQPWKIAWNDDRVFLSPDLRYALPAVDPDNRELYISLGCAIENLCIAARIAGFATEVKYGSPTEIVFSPAGDAPAAPVRASALVKRQTNRNVYDGRIVPENILGRLTGGLSSDGGVRVRAYRNGTDEFRTLSDYIVAGNAVQMRDARFKRELLQWMRFNPKEIARHGDGLTYRTVGAPPLPRWLAGLLVRSMLTPEKQNRSDRKKIESSSHLLLWTVDADRPESWLRAGRALERFFLKATHAGVAVAFMNQPCEVKSLAEELRTRFLTSQPAKATGEKKPEYPVLLLRIGYAEPAPWSPRREVRICR